MKELIAIDSMQRIVWYTNFGDLVVVAVYATHDAAALILASEFLRVAGVEVDGFDVRVSAVDSDLSRRVWDNARRNKDHVSASYSEF